MKELDADVHRDLPDYQFWPELVNAVVSERLHSGALLLRHRHCSTYHLHILFVVYISIVIILRGGDGQRTCICVLKRRGYLQAQHRIVCQASRGHDRRKRYIKYMYIFLYM